MNPIEKDSTQKSRFPDRYGLLVTAALLLFWPGGGQAQPAEHFNYDLTAIVLTGDTIDGVIFTNFNFHLDINDLGEVAFIGISPDIPQPPGGGDRSGIFTQNGAIALPDDIIGGQLLLSISLVPIINIFGEVAFLARIPDIGGIIQFGVFTQNGAIALPDDIVGVKTLNSFGRPSINDMGEVFFVADFLGGTAAGIFSESNGVIQPVFLGGDTIDSQVISFFGPLGINNVGDIAFRAFDSSFAELGLFTLDTAIVRPGDTIDGFTFSRIIAFPRPGINNSGEVVFVGVRPSPSGVGEEAGGFTQFGAVALKGDVIGEITLAGITAGFNPDINDSGVVVFAAGGGIFTQVDAVVLSGDIVDGKTLGGTVSPAINNNGEIAFRASFSDGTVGIVVASPVPANALPTALANGPFLGFENQPIELDASASFDPEGASLTYKWDFGDGTSLETTDSVIQHSFSSSGVLTVTLLVNDGETVVENRPRAFRRLDSFPFNTEATIGSTSSGGAADVDGFLALVSPTEKKTDLPVGRSTFDVILLYGPTIDPATFTATLNDEPFAGFQPVPGTLETVTVPLVEGKNILLLQVDGVSDKGKVATDRDKLEFTVTPLPPGCPPNCGF